MVLQPWESVVCWLQQPDERHEMLKMYTTRDEAIRAEIQEPLGEWVDHFDTEALADLCIEQHANGKYFCTVTSDEFWEYAQENAFSDNWKLARK